MAISKFNFSVKLYDNNSKIPLFEQNMGHTGKTLRWKIIRLNEVYKLLGHFLTKCIIYVLVLKSRNLVSL